MQWIVRVALQVIQPILLLHEEQDKQSQKSSALHHRWKCTSLNPSSEYTIQANVVMVPTKAPKLLVGLFQRNLQKQYRLL